MSDTINSAPSSADALSINSETIRCSSATHAPETSAGISQCSQIVSTNSNAVGGTYFEQ